MNTARPAVPVNKDQVTADHSHGFTNAPSVEEQSGALVDEIEMIGEEAAAGFRPVPSAVDANARFLHCSRTIHQLVTDRNRAVGLFLAIASLLWTASGAILNARPGPNLIVPLEQIQRWCLPVTLGVLSVLAFLTGLLLIRTRIGLIYEVAKMNVLLGLPIGRVQRINPLSIFFIMHLIVCLAGGCCATLLAYHLFRLFAPEVERPMIWSVALGSIFTVGLVATYMILVVRTTSDGKLDQRAKP